MLCPVFLFLPCVSRAAHGKKIICRVSDFMHTANYHLPVVKLDGGRGKIVGTPGGYAEGFVEKSFSFWV